MNIDYTLEPGRVLNKKREYNKHKPVISIVTPAWNSSDKIFQLANCILNQTYPYYEWLIIDDGSTNKESLRYFDKIQAMDSRISVLHKENQGLSKTRDYGVAHSSKETNIIVFIDDDDLLDPTYLETAYYAMCANPNASWCYSDIINFEGEESAWNKFFSSERMKYENLLVSQAMIRKEAFYDVGGFQIEGNGYYEDWIFWLKLLAKGHFPIHMSYYGFWYRRKKVSGQLKLAHSNHKRNMKQIAFYAEQIKSVVRPIEFPRENYHWDGIREQVDSVVIPKQKGDKRVHILVMVPWMTLGGADKFNLDLFQRIDKEKYFITLVAMQPTDYRWRQKFECACDEVFDLSTFLDRKDYLSFVQYLIESRKVDIIFNTNSQVGYSFLPYLHTKYPKLPILDYIHMEEWYNRNGGYSRDSAAVGSVIDKTLFCNKNSENILVHYFKRDPQSVGTVYIGVDEKKFDPKHYNKKKLREKYQIPTNRTIISLIARIDYQKRPFLLMEIIKKTVQVKQNVLFLIAGDGPLLDEIKGISRTEGLDEFVRFLGKSEHPDEIYAISDLTLNCSIKEGLALTSYESLAMGVPVVSSDVGGQKELICDEVGVIVPCLQKEEDIFDFSYSSSEVQNYVDGILKISSDLTRYQKACRQRILDGFTINNMVQNMEEEFQKLLKLQKTDSSTLSDHLDIMKELINMFLLADKGQYQWLVEQYNLSVYGSKSSEYEMSRKERIFLKCQELAVKLRIPEEAELCFHFFYEILRQLKHFVESIIMVPYLLIKLFIKFILLECHRVVRILKRKLSDD